MTTRERREARAARLREWAEKREAKSDAAAEKTKAMLDAIPLGQPILGDHYSAGRDRRYRDRAAATMGRAVEDGRKAREMQSKAANIEAAAEAAIYSDDPDAVEQLQERIAGLEAERSRVKAYNASCRRGAPDPSLLDEAQRALIERIAKVTPYALRKDGSFPGYHLSNLSGNIKRNRDRLTELEGIAQAGVDVKITKCDLTDRRMYVVVEAPEIMAAAPTWLRGYRNPFADPDVDAQRQHRRLLDQGARIAGDQGHEGYEPGTEPIVHAGFVEVVGKRLGFSDERRASVLAMFTRGGQMTAGGLMNAVTAAAQVVADADDAHGMEAKAIEVLDLVG
jgi:hypothetical protein